MNYLILNKGYIYAETSEHIFKYFGGFYSP